MNLLGTHIETLKEYDGDVEYFEGRYSSIFALLSVFGFVG